MDTTGTYQSAPLGRDAILRWTSGPFPKSVYKQVLALQPDLVTFWLGANDVLGYATSGGVSPSAPTPAATFAALYNQALNSLRQSLPNAKIIVANLPDVRAIPFFTTIGPMLGAQIGALGVKLAYQKKGETGIGTGQSSLSPTESGAPLLTLKGITYASLVGRPTGQWYKDNHYPALPAGIDTTKPFGLDPRNPWPDALTLDADEQATAGAAVTSFNATIASIAAANNAPVVDFYSFFNNVAQNGYSISGEEYSTAYISGALFSLDGVHPSSRGYGIIANEYIKTMNAKFGMSIPLVDISQLPGIPAPLGKLASGNSMPYIPPGAFKGMELLFERPTSQ
jgi:lysophospholipase L1-like esterase